MVDFQLFCDFIFMNGSAKNSAMQWVVCFFEVLNFTNEQYPRNSRNLRTLKKTNYTVIFGWALIRAVMGERTTDT